MSKKYISLNKLQIFLDNLKDLFATKTDIANLDYGGIPIVPTSGDGTAYTATVDGVTELKVGMKVTIIPNTVSSTTTPTLDVNNLGAKHIRMPVAYNTSATSGGAVETWLVNDKPVTLLYNGTYWVTSSLPRTSAQYLYGAVPIANGGTGADNVEDARANLGVYSKAEMDVFSTDTQNAIDELNTKIKDIEITGGNGVSFDTLQQEVEKVYEDAVAYTDTVVNGYVSKAEVETVELITVDDIDAICVL